jgi:hypothetical protein
MVYRFMSEHREEYTVREMAGVLGVSSSAYYKWAKKEASGERKGGDEELVDLIGRIQEWHHYRYGSPRVREALRRVREAGKPQEGGSFDAGKGP